jgi:uncharacterized protein YfkK (UPF0435 family)
VKRTSKLHIQNASVIDPLVNGQTDRLALPYILDLLQSSANTAKP